jgi:hypothetical protein
MNTKKFQLFFGWEISNYFLMCNVSKCCRCYYTGCKNKFIYIFEWEQVVQASCAHHIMSHDFKKRLFKILLLNEILMINTIHCKISSLSKNI